MKKILFLVLTLLSLIILNIVSDFVDTKYLLSDFYTSQFNIEEGTQDEFSNNTMPLDEYLDMIKNGEDPGLEDPSQFPLDIQYLNIRSFILRIFIFIITLALTGFAAFAMKSDRVDFAVLALDSSERGVNMVRISMYIISFMAAVLNAQKYPLVFLWGWIPTVLWAVNLIAITIWVLNIIYAFKERRAQKGKKLKPARL